ncbi:Thymidylate kinase [Corynebacterium camporealensis]|uniref:Thymidylate kinase n=1 Tax=Corynebacterium camporealensis TaxID=161896 RepID=A0A0F6QXC6_9CORY|nr:dTMP kinase [Corynebacterium camporealensis]AKE38608.1 thymidylate kinase [Corynebacterium camporealensis]AVH87897.1 Thymidylate kinase [Corynebacterium camporealensis]
MLVSIEGIDGAGKNTLVNRLRTELDREFPVLSFPRYADSIHAQLAQEALYGRMGDMTDSAYAMATLFALDRHGVREQLAAAAAQPDILLLDRYVASNAAYSAARLGDDAVMDWVYDLEFGKLSLPKPRLQVFLDTAVEVAADRAEQRAAADATRELDRYERDADLQANTAAAYRRLAEREWAGQWIATADTDRIIQVIKELIGK